MKIMNLKRTILNINRLIIALSFIAMAACSSNNKASTDQDITPNTNTSIDMAVNGSGDIDYKYQEQAQASIKMQQHNNIIYFDFDKSDISLVYADILDGYANLLRRNPSYKVTVEGHADERGTPEYNISLGERRANAVKIYLQSKGVSADQISIISYGKEKPALLGHDEAAYAKNRRAVLVLVY